MSHYKFKHLYKVLCKLTVELLLNNYERNDFDLIEVLSKYLRGETQEDHERSMLLYVY
jgi:hypothetical protein